FSAKTETMATMRPTRPPKGEVRSVVLIGLEPKVIFIEAVTASGTGVFQIAGLSEAHARESRIRVRAALQQVGVDLHNGSVTVQVGAGNVLRSGSFDAPMAMAVLGALDQISTQSLKDTVVLGELSLTGTMRPVRGVLPSLRGAVAHGI